MTATKRIETTKASPEAINWLLAQILDMSDALGGPEGDLSLELPDFKWDGDRPLRLLDDGTGSYVQFTPSTSWAQGGPLLEDMLRQGLSIAAVDSKYRRSMPAFKATRDQWETIGRGETMLLAGFRAHLASVLGESSMVPDGFAPPDEGFRRHELWKESETELTFCMAGAEGESARALLAPGAKLVWTVDAKCRWEAMEAYYGHMGWGPYVSDDPERDRKLYSEIAAKTSASAAGPNPKKPWR